MFLYVSASTYSPGDRHNYEQYGGVHNLQNITHVGPNFMDFYYRQTPEKLRKSLEIPQLFEGKKLSFVGLANGQ